jgi:hypothetical protein
MKARVMQRRAPVVVPEVLLGARAQQRLDDLEVALERGVVYRRGLGGVEHVRIPLRVARAQEVTPRSTSAKAHLVIEQRERLDVVALPRAVVQRRRAALSLV